MTVLSQHNGALDSITSRLKATVWDNGTVTIATAALLFSLGTLSVKFLEPQIPTFQVAFIPSCVCWVITTAMMWSQGTSFLAKGLHVRLLTLLRGLLGAASLTLYYIAIEMLPLKDAVTLFFCSPVLAAMLEFLVNREMVTRGSLTSCTLTVMGVFLVTQPEGMDHIVGPAAPVSLGMVIALLAATCNAMAFVIVRSLKGRQSPVTLTWWYHLTVMVVSAVPLAAHYPHAPVIPNGTQTALLAFICCAQLCGQLLLNRGFQLMSATRGSAINVLQVVFSYVWELTILREPLQLISSLGGLCVVAGVMVIAFGDPDATAVEGSDLASPTQSDLPEATKHAHTAHGVPHAYVLANPHEEVLMLSDMHHPVAGSNRTGTWPAAAVGAAGHSQQHRDTAHHLEQ